MRYAKVAMDERPSRRGPSRVRYAVIKGPRPWRGSTRNPRKAELPVREVAAPDGKAATEPVSEEACCRRRACRRGPRAIVAGGRARAAAASRFAAVDEAGRDRQGDE